MIVLCSFISPFRAERRAVRELVEEGEFIEVFIDTPLDECIRRDPKGLYARALEKKTTNFTGLGSPYEWPEVVVHTLDETPEEVAQRILRVLKVRNILN